MKYLLLSLAVMWSAILFSQPQNSEPFTATEVLNQNKHVLGKSYERSTHAVTHQLDSFVIYNYSYFGQTWNQGATTHFTYYNDGTVESQISEIAGGYKDISFFHTNGKMDYHKFQSFNGTSFEEFYNTVYVYDLNGDVETDTNYKYVNNMWEVTGYSEYVLDGSGFVIEKNSFSVDTLGVITPTYHFTYSNNGDGKVINLTTAVYMNSQWVNNYTYFYSYDGNGRLDESLTQYWDISGWTNVQKSEHHFSADNKTLLENFSWNVTGWLLDGKEEYQYNENIFSDDVWATDLVSDNEHITTASQSYFLYNGTWNYNDTTLYFYSALGPNSISEVNSADYYTLQTNPVQNQITILNKKGLKSEVKIYSISGKLVHAETTNSATIEVSATHLNNGLYYVHINNSDHNTVLKAVVSR